MLIFVKYKYILLFTLVLLKYLLLLCIIKQEIITI
nr:MAG TPA: hypothetical protein [Caudoviricetes sp.]